jgi:hypothetical protein
MKTRTIIHARFKNNSEDVYYGSVKLLIEDHPADRTGVICQTVRNYMSLNKTKYFENDKIFIEKVILKLDEHKKQNKK